MARHLGGPRARRSGGPVDHYRRAVEVDLAAVGIGRMAHLGADADHPVRPQVSGLFEHAVQGRLVSRHPGVVQPTDLAQPPRAMNGLFVAGTRVICDRRGGVVGPVRYLPAIKPLHEPHWP